MKKKANTQAEPEYPRIKSLGLELCHAEPDAPPGVLWLELQLALADRGLSIQTFSQFYGVQTQGPNGMYPWDVEAVLERMLSGKKQGTQLVWD